jgi:hypothetical protein
VEENKLSFQQSVGKFNSDSFLKEESQIFFSSIFALLLLSGAGGRL